MRRLVCRSIHRLAHRLDRLGWWLADPGLARRKRVAEKECLTAQFDGAVPTDE